MKNSVVIIVELSEDQDSDYLQNLLDREDLSSTVIPRDELVDMEDRQKTAILSLLMAFDLPVDMMRAAHNMLLAGFIDQGATAEQMGEGHRRKMLERARDLVNGMLEDLA